MTIVRVALGDRSYPIHIVQGGLEGLGVAAAEVLPVGLVMVVTNPVVGALYLEATLTSLRAAGFAPVSIEIPDGEAHKTAQTWLALVEDLLTAGMDRRTPVIALGGGVTGDIAGFAAATVLRGVPLVQVPTSLLAMVDSSVGGKTGVNSPRGKNLIGAFHQPRLVYAALETLRTLPDAESRSGLGEAVKHGVIRDPELLDFCETQAAAVSGFDPSALGVLVERSCRVKAAVVAADEREGGLRAILNFGHTVGHAIENALGYGELRHGECVAIGMAAETRWAANTGACSVAQAERLERIMADLGLVAAAPLLSQARLLEAARADKKRSRGTLSLPVVTHLGSVQLRTVPVGALPELLRCIPGPRSELERRS